MFGCKSMDLRYGGVHVFKKPPLVLETEKSAEVHVAKKIHNKNIITKIIKDIDHKDHHGKAKDMKIIDGFIESALNILTKFPTNTFTIPIYDYSSLTVYFPMFTQFEDISQLNYHSSVRVIIDNDTGIMYLEINDETYPIVGFVKIERMRYLYNSIVYHKIARALNGKVIGSNKIIHVDDPNFCPDIGVYKLLAIVENK